MSTTESTDKAEERRAPRARMSAMAVGLNTLGIWVGRRREDKIRFGFFVLCLAALFGYASYKYMKLSEQSENNAVVNTANLLGIKSSMNFASCNQGSVCAKISRCADAGLIDQPPITITPFNHASAMPKEDGYFIPSEQNVLMSANGAANLCDLHKCVDGKCQSASFIVIAAGL